MREDGTLEKVEEGADIKSTPIDLSTLTDDDLRNECRESLVMMMRANKGKLNALAAIRELLDRMDGKPAQSLHMTVKQDPVSKLTDDQLAALLAQLDDPLIIPPLQKL